jgi:hypothetical protein
MNMFMTCLETKVVLSGELYFVLVWENEFSMYGKTWIWILGQHIAGCRFN